MPYSGPKGCAQDILVLVLIAVFLITTAFVWLMSFGGPHAGGYSPELALVYGVFLIALVTAWRYYKKTKKRKS